MKLTILSGRSGSGKTTALQALEDHGYYCVDNLPLGMLPTLAAEMAGCDPAVERVAAGVDARNLPTQLQAFDNILNELRTLGANPEVIFLDADESALLKRFSATRRPHPLGTQDRTLADAIRAESQLLANIRMRADLVIDTSSKDVHSLRELIGTRVAKRKATLSLQVESFGFKNGLPNDADLVFDVRMLPNPHWHPELRPLTGLDTPICDFLAKHDDCSHMLDDLFTFITRWLPAYAANDRSYITVAIGCTGGRHRSVYIAEQLTKRLREEGITPQVRHRELNL